MPLNISLDIWITEKYTFKYLGTTWGTEKSDMAIRM